MSEPSVTRWQRRFDSVLGTTIAALVIGFFAILWRSSVSNDATTADLRGQIDALRAQSRGSNDVLAEEIAKLRTGLRRLEEGRAPGAPPAPNAAQVPPLENAFPELPGTAPDSALKIRREIQQSIHERAQEAK